MYDKTNNNYKLISSPLSGGYTYGNLALQVGGVSNETVK
jgi:hypothetical protein